MATSKIFSQTLLCGLFCVLGFLCNWFKIPLYFNVDFLTGSVFPMLAILVLGRVCGIITAFIAGTCTYLLWNHPWAIIIFTGEAVVVSWLYSKRKGNLVIYDLLYWVCLGMPMVYLFYHHIMGVMLQDTFVIMLKQSVNGVSNALLAMLALVLFKFVKKPAGLRTSYSELLFLVLVSFALLPTMLISISAIRTYEENRLETLQSKVTSISETAQKTLADWITEHHDNVRILARLVGDPNTTPFENMQHYIETVKAANPAFKGMGVFDRNSITVSYSPLEQDGKPNLGVDMSARSHIAFMRRTK